MALMQREPKAAEEQEASIPVKIIQSVIKPVMEAQHYFYKEHPKAFLEFVLTALFVVLVVIGQIFATLPVGLYFALCIWILCYFRLPEDGYRLLLKIKKKKKGSQ